MRKMRYIKYGGMLLTNEERNAIWKAVNKNYWPLGKEGDLMEKEAAKLLGIRYGILANSGSSAGLLALTALELPKGSEVIIPATTFPTIFNIILQLGLIPVVVDSKVGTYNLDPKEIEAAISEKTKAIICVHAVGNPCDMPKIMEIANKHKLYVIEDNCDGWGSEIKGKKVGTFGHISFTSFHAAHIVSMGQGGGVFTDHKELARKVRMYRDWGRQSDIERRTNDGKWETLPDDYDMRFIYEKIGYNLQPLELQAAMGRVQLRKSNKIKKLRQRNFKFLYEHLKKYEQLVMPVWIDGADVCWFSFPLTIKNGRGPLVAHLEKNGIETRSMFAGNITKHPAYLESVFRVSGKLDEANLILTNSFWISVHPRLTKQDLNYIIEVFDEYFKIVASNVDMSYQQGLRGTQEGIGKIK